MCTTFPDDRQPQLCILPPHLLKHLARQTSKELAPLAQAALHTLALSERMRGERQAIGGIVPLAATPAGEKRRTIYDAGGGEALPGKLVRGEGDRATGDAAVDEAYDGAGATWDLYSHIYRRNSIDGHGMRLDSSAHYSKRYDNAFWNGRQMVYGDGDGVLFDRFTKSVDVIGHELTHGVTQFEAALEYHEQPGALNESFSDVFGSLVKQYVLQQTAAQADWLIGQGLFMPTVSGDALRSMKAPGTAYDDPRIGKDPQPAHMKDYVDTYEDQGGVHINSGIPNRAFYLAATGLGGFAWAKAGLVWYVTLCDRLRSNATFADAAAATIGVAGEEFGAHAAQKVADAWSRVGVTLKKSTPHKGHVTTLERAAALSPDGGRRAGHERPAAMAARMGGRARRTLHARSSAGRKT